MSTLSPGQRSRSPRFPGYSIKEAIEYAKRIYGGVHRATVPSDTIFRLMGFAGKSGPSSAALGALRQFGLIEGVGDRTRVTDLALSIVQPASEEERIEGVRLASRNPEVFRLIHERFDGHVPSADEPIKAYLIRELGFSKRGADECLNSLRKTLRTLEELTGDTGFDSASTMEATDPVDAPNDPVVEANQTRQSFSAPQSNEGEFIRLPLTRDCVAELRFDGKVSERAIAALMRHIELMKEIWADD
jgi:hypothetical protein